jgi:alpha-N-arabinofuranosidase
MSSTTWSHPAKLSEAPIRISPNQLADPTAGPISPLIFGGFLEHLGRCIYGGIVDDPKHPSPAELVIPQPQGRLSWRKDVLRIFKEELEVPVFRWPGGNFVSNYHWQDGIGAQEKRPKRVELAWLSDESNR